MGDAPDHFGPPPCIHPATLAATLVEMTSRALAGRDCGDLASTSWSRTSIRLVHQDGHGPGPIASTVPIDRVDLIDPDAVAKWVVDQYPARPFPAVVLGSPHGAAAHLAAALRAAWLPTSFECTLTAERNGDLGGVIELGRTVGLRIGRQDDAVEVRQVFDPIRYGDGVLRHLTYHLGWRRLPEAYRVFLDTWVRSGGIALLIRDNRRWPVLLHDDAVSFQLGAPMAGLTPTTYRDFVLKRAPGLADLVSQELWINRPAEQAVPLSLDADLRDWARANDRAVVAIGYEFPAQLSAAVADIHRAWLRSAGKPGDRLVVECGRLLDPYHILRAGLVPYWCEAPTTAALAEAELWLGACEPFATVDLLPEPTGRPWPRLAPFSHWQALAKFASRHGAIDDGLAGSYPLQTTAPRDATEALRRHPYDLPPPPTLRAINTIAALRGLAMNHPASPVALSVRGDAGPSELPQPSGF